MKLKKCSWIHQKSAHASIFSNAICCLTFLNLFKIYIIQYGYIGICVMRSMALKPLLTDIDIFQVKVLLISLTERRYILDLFLRIIELSVRTVGFAKCVNFFAGSHTDRLSSIPHCLKKTRMNTSHARQILPSCARKRKTNCFHQCPAHSDTT